MTEIPEGVTIKISQHAHILIFPDPKQGIPKGVSVYLAHTFHEWVMKNPHCRVRASVGIVENGQTVMYHVWYNEEAGHEGR